MRKSHTGHNVATLAALALILSGLSACGGGGGNDSQQVVARIEGSAQISKATLEHWIPVVAVLLYQDAPTKAIPDGVVPDPPDFKACSAYLASIKQETKPTAAELKRRCRNRLQELSVVTLNTLIGWRWTIANGLKLGFRVSQATVKQRFNEGNSRLFPNGEVQFTRYLKLTRQTVSDMLLRSEVQAYETKVHERFIREATRLAARLTGGKRKAAVAKLVQGLPPGKQWVAITSCAKGYVVSACREYRGPEPPGIPN